MRGREAGQATIEWVALVGLVGLLLAGSTIVVSKAAAIGFADSVLHVIVCAVRGGCDDDPESVERAYGDDVAGLVRKFAPEVIYETDSAGLPIDFRRCRDSACSDGPNAHRAIDRSSAGLPVTAFTRVVDNRARGGSLYVQYWFYYPESFSGGIGRELGIKEDWPGFHPDDWEAYAVRIAPDGKLAARATAHGEWKNFKHSKGWGPWTGYYRVSGGSHAGHLVSKPTGERSTKKHTISLIPLETLRDTDLYQFEVSPPWRKAAYENPEATSS